MKFIRSSCRFNVVKTSPVSIEYPTYLELHDTHRHIRIGYRNIVEKRTVRENPVDHSRFATLMKRQHRNKSSGPEEILSSFFGSIRAKPRAVEPYKNSTTLNIPSLISTWQVYMACNNVLPMMFTTNGDICTTATEYPLALRCYRTLLLVTTAIVADESSRTVCDGTLFDVQLWINCDYAGRESPVSLYWLTSVPHC